ncbi:hypothetical protein [Pseudomonas sp. Z3-8]|uniref:hypothetical protein n=1 Tax=Pseudomonas sp. Z3-8 TaxID=2817412 RepID=UPI003DA8BDF8
MTEPLNISINKSFVPYGGKVFASFENGWGVTVQVYEGETLLTQQEMTYAEYVALQKEALPVPLPDYPDPRLNRTPGGTNANGNTIGRVVGETAPATVPASQANPPIKAETDTEKGWWNSASPWVHGGFDVLGFVPGVGVIPDLINAGIYAAEGDAINAGLSATAAIPFAGDAIKGSLLIAKAGKKTGVPAQKINVAGTAKKDTNGGKVFGNEKCLLRPYRPNKCAKGLAGHHVVPDRAFRLGGREKKIRNQIPGGLSEAEGLVICVNPTQHNKIHSFYDKAETVLGLSKTPQGTASLLELEILGSGAASKFTGCNKGLLQAQLRAYHELQELDHSFKVRADKNGNLARKSPPGSLGKLSNGEF